MSEKEEGRRRKKEKKTGRSRIENEVPGMIFVSSCCPCRRKRMKEKSSAKS